MSDAIEARGRLRDLADELDTRSRQLGDVERELEPVERKYQGFVDDFEVGLWTKYEDSEGKTKLPPEPMRLKLAHKAMDPELLGRYVGLVNARKRLEKRIGALGKTVEAQRSILSALKAELEATR